MQNHEILTIQNDTVVLGDPYIYHETLLIAEFERVNIRTQTMAGREQKAREGRWNGGFAPYGYKLENGELKIAYGRRKTEKKIGTRNEMHVVKQDDFPVYEGQHEAIVSETEWN